MILENISVELRIAIGYPQSGQPGKNRRCLFPLRGVWEVSSQADKQNKTKQNNNNNNNKTKNHHHHQLQQQN